jgi:DNA-binding transcriptional MerR regulator
MEQGIGIDEFARRCETTVRMVREYQTLGVLPPPQKIGRNAYYGDEHLQRWNAVAQLQARGYSLAAIADLFDAWQTGSSLPSVLGVTGAAVGAVDETPVLVDAKKLEREVPALFAKPSLVRRAIKAGLVQRHSDDTYAVRSPALVQLVADAMNAGISPAKALSIVETIDADTADIATNVLVVLGDAVSTYDADEHLDLLRRGRPLLAQAVASTVIHHVGRQLAAAAADRPDVAKLIDDLRIGAVNDTTAKTSVRKRAANR